MGTLGDYRRTWKYQWKKIVFAGLCAGVCWNSTWCYQHFWKITTMTSLLGIKRFFTSCSTSKIRICSTGLFIGVCPGMSNSNILLSLCAAKREPPGQICHRLAVRLAASTNRDLSITTTVANPSLKKGLKMLIDTRTKSRAYGRHSAFAPFFASTWLHSLPYAEVSNNHILTGKFDRHCRP